MPDVDFGILILHGICNRIRRAYPQSRCTRQYPHEIIVTAFGLLTRAFLCTVSLLLPSVALAATIEGTVTAAETGRPIPGATIMLDGTRIGAVSEPTGTYRISRVPTGRYTIIVTSIGYRPDTAQVNIADEGTVLRHDARMRVRAVGAHEVVVTARSGRETDLAARADERTSPSVLNILSAESIQRYPDASTAEVAKRIPGVSITRVRGEAREAIVRGMEPRYNSTLLDGVKLPSPATNSRIVQLDYLSSDLLERVEVAKSLTPDMEADAIGGAVNLVMRSAPEGRLLRARVGGGYGTALLDNDFLAFRTDSILTDPIDRFGRGYQAAPGDFTRDNLKLEPRRSLPDYLAEVTFGDRMLDDRLGVLVAGSMQQIYQISQAVRNYDAVDADNNLYLIRKQHRLHSQDKTKWGLNLKADYIIDSGNEIDLALNGFMRQNREARVLSDTNFVYSPILYDAARSVFQQHLLGDAVLSGRHELGSIGIKWRGGWAAAAQLKPDRAELTTSAALAGDTVISEPVFFSVVRDWQRNDDRDIFAGADIDWKSDPDLGISVTAGGLFRAKDRKNYMNEYRLNPMPDSLGHLPLWTSVDQVSWEVLNTGGTPDYANNNYRCTEDVTALYLMGSWSSGPLNVLAGARWEQTAGEYFTNDVNLMAQLHATKKYSDLLPSIHLRYALDDESSLRLSVGQSISRPNYFDVVPYNYVGEDYREMGNPQLKRTLATNLDLRYELYPGAGQTFSAGMFYKAIQDPIEISLDITNPALPTLMPKNFGSATNFGGELVAITDIWGNFSVQATYTYTHSAITTQKILNDRQSGTVRTVMETRPLQGQSAHIGNLALYYDDRQSGTMGQVSFTFQGRRLSQVSPYAEMNHFESDYPMLDISFEQRILPALSVFLRLNNLTDSPYEVRNQDGTLIEQEKFGQTATIGVNLRY